MKNPAEPSPPPPVSGGDKSSTVLGDPNTNTNSDWIDDMGTVTDVTAMNKDAAAVQSDLFTSAARGNLKRIKFMYKHDKAILFHRDDNGFVPLHIAALHNRLEVMQFFIQKQEDAQEYSVSKRPLVSERSHHGWTPLLMSVSAPKVTKAEKAHAIKCIQFLLDNGADPNMSNDDGVTACHIATMENMPDVLRLLVKYHAKVTHVDVRGKKPIDIARSNGFKECARVLMAGEWGTSDDYFHQEVKKLTDLKRYRDDIRRELDIISLFEADLERTQNFKDWLESKGLDDSKNGAPHLTEAPVSVEEKEITKTHYTVFGPPTPATTASKSGKSAKKQQPSFSPRRHKSAICDACGKENGAPAKPDYPIFRGPYSAGVNLPNLRSTMIESVLFGSQASNRASFKSNSLLDNQKKRSWDRSLAGAPQTSVAVKSQMATILRDIPEGYQMKTSTVKATSSTGSSMGETLLSKAAKVPITWKGKPATVKDYLLEKSFIC